MSSAEAADFEKNQHFKEAVQLRRWDDRAKIEGLPTAPLAHYRELIDRTSAMHHALNGERSHHKVLNAPLGAGNRIIAK